MKKSEMYTDAMLAVIENARISAEDKLDIIERLMTDRNLARWNEEQQEKARAAEEAEKW